LLFDKLYKFLLEFHGNLYKIYIVYYWHMLVKNSLLSDFSEILTFDFRKLVANANGLMIC